LLHSHQLQQFKGQMFQKISLADIGHIQYLGHHGKPCSPISQEEFGAWEDDNQMDLDDLADLTGPEETYTQILVVGTSGISNHHFHFCTCPNAASEVEQLAEARLFPASYNKIRTTFTFQVLDDCYEFPTTMTIRWLKVLKPVTKDSGYRCVNADQFCFIDSVEYTT
jgi:hypothetical protein